MAKTKTKTKTKVKAKTRAKTEMAEPAKPSLFLVNAALLGLVVWTAVAIVDTSHRCRQLYAELQSLQAQQWDMQEHWSRLLLEESTWATYHRVEQVATDRLGMHMPVATDIRVLVQ